MVKVKIIQRILKAARVKQGVLNKGIPIRLSADFAAETAAYQEVAQYFLY